MYIWTTGLTGGISPGGRIYRKDGFSRYTWSLGGIGHRKGCVGCHAKFNLSLIYIDHVLRHMFNLLGILKKVIHVINVIKQKDLTQVKIVFNLWFQKRVQVFSLDIDIKVQRRCHISTIILFGTPCTNLELDKLLYSWFSIISI